MTFTDSFRKYKNLSLNKITKLIDDSFSLNKKEKKEILSAIFHELRFRKNQEVIDLRKIILKEVSINDLVTNLDINRKNNKELIKKISDFNESNSKKIVDLLKDGFNANQISKKLSEPTHKVRESILEHIYEEGFQSIAEYKQDIFLKKYQDLIIQSYFELSKPVREISSELSIPTYKINSIIKNHKATHPNELKPRISKKKYEKCLHITNLRKEGKTLEEIGSIYGITRERVRQLEKFAFDNGISDKYDIFEVKVRSRQLEIDKIIDNLSNEKKMEIIKTYKNGYSDDHIASKFNLSLKALKHFIEEQINTGYLDRRLKVRDEIQIAKNESKWKEILQYRKDGLTNKQIANIYGVSSARISRDIQYMRARGFIVPGSGLSKTRDYNSERNDGEIEYRSKIITKLNNEGKSKKDIADFLGIGMRSLYHHIDIYMLDY